MLEFFLGRSNGAGVPPAAYRNVFGRTIFSAPYFRIWAAKELTIDIRTPEGPARLRGKVLNITKEGLVLRLHRAAAIDLPSHQPMSHEMSQAEKDRIRRLHDEAGEVEPIFDCDLAAAEAAEKALLRMDGAATTDDLFQFERKIATACRKHPSKRAKFLEKEAFHPALREIYEAHGHEAPSALPYLFIEHKAIDAIRLHEDARFIRYARWTGALRELASYVISSTSTDIAKKAMIAVRKEIARKWPERKREFRLLLCIHDELIYEVPEAEAKEFKEILIRVMRRKPHARFIAKVDAKPGVGANYEEAKP